MRRSWTLVAGVALLISCYAWAQTPKKQTTLSQTPGQAAGRIELKTTRDQASYALGIDLGRSLQSQREEISTEAFLQGLRDVLNNTKPQLTDEQCQAAVQAFQQEMASKMETRRQQAGTTNQANGKAFLAQNAKKAGVVTLPSGLQYTVMKKGNGPSPKITDKVRTHYHGTLIDGTVFDSSVQRGEPISFPVGGVIRGWTEALQLMKVGDKWKLFIPSELAYGTDGAGGMIGPNAVLIFEVELLGIENEGGAAPKRN